MLAINKFLLSLCITALTTPFFISAATAQSLSPVSSAVPELKFRDFYRMPVGPRGLEISDKLRKLDGQIVTLTGYMVQQETQAAGYFLLTPRPVQMSEHADGEADDLPPSTVLVLLDVTQKDWVVSHARGLVSLTGRLAIGRQEGSAGRISWVRLQLPTEATRSISLVEHTAQQDGSPHKH